MQNNIEMKMYIIVGSIQLEYAFIFMNKIMIFKGNNI